MAKKRLFEQVTLLLFHLAVRADTRSRIPLIGTSNTWPFPPKKCPRWSNTRILAKPPLWPQWVKMPRANLSFYGRFMPRTPLRLAIGTVRIDTLSFHPIQDDLA